MNDIQKNNDIEAQIETWLAEMTLEEKVSLCHADSKFGVAGIKRLGIPAVEMSDGPHGVRPEISKDSWNLAGWDDDHATYLPTGTAQAACWNPDMMVKAGEVLGAEARERGKDYILGPGINMIRTPLCGRNFEYYGEDPYQVGKLAAQVIRGIQSQDVAACAKHYAVNSQELNRFKTDVEVSERALREIYLEAFRRAVQEGGVLSVMGSYNKLRGQHCCHNKHLVNDILKSEWGFSGTYISDWAGVKETKEAALNGLDIEMGSNVPYDDYYLADPFLEALRSGEIAESVLDDKVRRCLRVILSIGMLDEGRKPGARNTAEHQKVARQIGEEAVVLLKNETKLLPLDKKKIKKIAVLGQNAQKLHSFGGNSSEVKALYEISPLRGLQEYCGSEIEIIHAQGYPEQSDSLEPIVSSQMKTVDEAAGVRGWKRSVNNGQTGATPLRVDFTDEVNFKKGDIDAQALGLVDHFEVVWKGEWLPTQSGRISLGILCDGNAQVWIDGEKVEEIVSNEEADNKEFEHPCEAGKAIQIKLVYQHNRYSDAFSFGLAREGGDGTSELSKAVACAEQADVVCFFGGLSHQYDVEGQDRKTINLPLGQNEVLEAVLAVNPNVVVTLVSGAACAMPWIDRVPAVLQGWYAGMECGRIFADILFGEVNPSGKLPMTFPRQIEDIAAHSIGTYESDLSLYSEGIFIGYRHFDRCDIVPLFAFGHGLSYTRFEYSAMKIEDFNSDLKVNFKLRNTGSVQGKEVVQLYVEYLDSKIERATRELKGFAKVKVEPGCSEQLELIVKRDDLATYDEDQQAWQVEPGKVRIHLGSSSRDLRLYEDWLIE